MQGRVRQGARAVALVAGALLLVPAAANAEVPHVPGEVIVQFESDSSAAERADVRDETETSVLEGLGARGTKLLGIDDGRSVAETIRELEADPAVAHADANKIEYPSAVPNDPSFGSLWGMHNLGQNVNGIIGQTDADIDAPEAWDTERGNTNTVVAIMDSGIDPTHPDLASMLWENPGEIAGNGIDDDGNGFVDDFNGYDFFGTGDPSPLDDLGHGTHVAGTAAAAGDNGVGVTGVSQVASIMVLRVCSMDGGCPQSDQIQAINYAGDNGAHVLNGSLGGFASSENATRRDAIFSHPNTLFVWAAGNDGASADNTPAECNPDADPCRAYPCAHAPAPGETDNTLCVAATNDDDIRPGFSNFGATSVDVGAPGTNVLSANAEREHFLDTFAVDDFATRWNANGADDNWQQTNEAPLDPSPPTSRFGITESPGPANYAPDTNYGTITDPIPVGAVSERGCAITIRRSIDLALGDSFRVTLLHNGAFADPDEGDFVFSQASDSPMLTQTLPFDAPASAGNLQVRLRLVSVGATVANGVHVDSVRLECGETPGPGNFDFKQGTSMSSPHVAGAAGLIFSRNPELSTTDVRNLILGSVDPKASMSGVTTSGGRLNVGTAIARTPPTTSITGGPGEGQEIGASARRRGGFNSGPGARPDFSFASSDPHASFECSIDSDPFTPCPSPLETRPLGPGAHTLSARAVDPRGNADATPATRGFAVESDPPQTRITKGPKKRTDARKAKIKFKSDEPGSTFECKVDRKRFRPCRSPKRLKRLDPARHKFLVRAVDPVGNVDTSAAKKRWRVSKR